MANAYVVGLFLELRSPWTQSMVFIRGPCAGHSDLRASPSASRAQGIGRTWESLSGGSQAELVGPPKRSRKTGLILGGRELYPEECLVKSSVPTGDLGVSNTLKPNLV